MKFRRSTLAASAVTATLLLAGCGGSDTPEEVSEPSVAEAPVFEEGTTMSRIAEQGTVNVAVKYDVPNFGFTDLEGTPEGFDVLIAEYIAAQMGLAPEDITYTEAVSAAREDLVENGTVDFVVATYTINDTRRERITFAGPYYTAGQQIMVNAGDDTVSAPEDLADNPDWQVCSQTGSTPDENIRQFLAGPDQLTSLDGYDFCLEAMENGTVDGITTDNVILSGFVAESDGAYELVGEQFTEEPYGIGLPKGDVEFCTFINETLAQADDEGLYDEWWEATAGQVEGIEAPELPEPDECV